MTGGYTIGDKTLDTVEAFSLDSRGWRTLPPLPAGAAGHGQSSVGGTRTFGGRVGGEETGAVMKMGEGGEWRWSNITLGGARTHGAVALFPGDLIKC